MNTNVLVAAITAASSVAVAITALLLNHRGFADLRSEMNNRFDDLYRYIDARFKGIEDRLERLEHPVVR